MTLLLSAIILIPQLFAILLCLFVSCISSSLVSARRSISSANYKFDIVQPPTETVPVKSSSIPCISAPEKC